MPLRLPSVSTGVVQAARRVDAPTWALVLVLAWIVWADWLSYAGVLRLCSSVGMAGGAAHSREGSVRVAVVSDPQLTDFYSYSFMRNGGVLPVLTAWISDVYMYRSFRALQDTYEPHAVVFLGDLFDGGRVASSTQYAAEYARYTHVFGRTAAGARAHFLNVSGNHDIGLGREYLSAGTLRRYEEHFGPAQYVFHVGGWSVVTVCAPCLAERVDGITDAAWKQLEQLAREIDASGDDARVVLLTHVPLHRAPGTTCGPLRTRADLSDGSGISYRNLLDPETSARLLRMFRPEIVLSGDDHSVCEVLHSVDGHQYAEATMGTFSWLQGVFNPQVGLLELPRGRRRALSLEHCPLRRQHMYFAGYGVIVLAACVVWFVRPCACPGDRSRRSAAPQSPTAGTYESPAYAYGASQRAGWGGAASRATASSELAQGTLCFAIAFAAYCFVQIVHS